MTPETNENSVTMEVAAERSEADHRTLSNFQSERGQLFPGLDFFGSFFGNEKKNQKNTINKAI